jgi:hypothetical protein
VFSLPTAGVAGGEGDGKMRRANPEPETEPTKEPNAAAKATLVRSFVFDLVLACADVRGHDRR